MYTNRANLPQNAISLSIPLISLSEEELVVFLRDKFAGRYTISGKVFFDNETKEYCLLDIYELEDCDRLIEYYQTLGLTKEQCQNWRQIVVLTSYKLGYAACCQMAQYAQVFLELGGTAVVVNAAEIVRNKNKWLENYNSQDVFDIYSLYVNLIEGEDRYYSLGMSNFGKAEVSLELTEDIGLANYVMNVFNYYRLTESVILQDEQKFQPDLECPLYEMVWQEDLTGKNSFGRWHLSRVEQALNISYEIN